MKEIKREMVVVIALFLCLFPGLSWAAQATAQASVSATIPSLTTIALDRDEKSTGRGSADTIIFDKRDDQDLGSGIGDAGFMYAPYRSEEGFNWHVAEIGANGSSLTLGVNVAGAIDQIPLSSVLKLWSGGFFRPGESVPISGTASTVWEFADGWQRQLNQPFTGTVPFVYQLNVSGLPSGGPFTGTITFTLTTT